MLVRRRIQTPSVATVLSVVQPEGEVVLGASPPARRFAAGGFVCLCGDAVSAEAGTYGSLTSRGPSARANPPS